MANLSNINGKFVVDTVGNIGVGTLTPRSDANTTNISIQSSGTARLFVNNTGASGKEYAIYSSANGDFGIFDYGAVSARLVINSAGNATFAGNITAPGLVYNATNKYLSISHWASPPTPAAILHLSDNANDIDVPQIRIEGRENPGDTRLDISVKDPDVRFNLVEGSTDASSGYGLMIFKTNASPQASFPTRGGFNFQTPASSSSLFITNEANVGIGTASPSATEPIGGNLPTGWTRANSRALEIAAPDFANSGLFLRNSDTTATGTDITGDHYYGDTYIDNRFNNDNGSIYFRTKTAVSPQIRMAIKGSGKVGINTTSPAFKTHIRGGSGTEETVLKIDKSSAADSGGHTTIVGLGVESAGWAKAGIGFERTGAYDTGKMHFLMYPTGLNTNSVGLSNSVMTINNDGNVGVGTTSPLKLLTVKKATSTNTIATSEVMRLAGTAQVVGNKNELGFANYDNNYNASVVIGAEIMSTAAYLKQDLYFATRDSTSDIAPTERMRITSDGSLARNSKKVWNFTAVKSFTEGGSSNNFFRLNFNGNQAVLANITLMSNNSATGSRTMQSVQAMLAVSYQGYLPTMTEISKTPVSNNGSSYISAVQGANGSLTFLCDTTNNSTGTSNTTFVSVELISNGALNASITVL